MDAKIKYVNIFFTALILLTAFMCNVNAEPQKPSNVDPFVKYEKYMTPQTSEHINSPTIAALTKGTIAGGLTAAFFLLLFTYKFTRSLLRRYKEKIFNKLFFSKFSEIQLALYSAENGDQDAQAAIGWMYFKGLNVKQDFKQAYVWLSVSAANGCKHAQKWRDVASKKLSKSDFEDAASKVVIYYDRYKKRY